MKIAIFNGINMHFEMFGYIIYLCNKNNYDLTIYSPTSRHGWEEFYNKLFNNIAWKSPDLINDEYNEYKYIFLATDDDPGAPKKLLSISNVICIDHYYQIRTPEIPFKFHIAVRPFLENNRKWALPCYPIIKTCIDKTALIQLNKGVNVAIVGGCNDYNVADINRLSSEEQINLHFISRTINPSVLKALHSKFNTYLHANISTVIMMSIIKQCKYIVCDVTMKHITGKSMSASIPLAFSNLNKLVISNTNNNLYKFKSAQTFNINTNEPIMLDNTTDYLEDVYAERELLVQQLHDHFLELQSSD